MKLLRRSMILMCMLVGVYFAATDVSANAGTSCYQGCLVARDACLYDYDCYDNPNNLGCNFCENRYESCIASCRTRPGTVPQ